MSKMTDKEIIKHIYGCENKDCRVIVIFNKPEDTIDEITIGDIADVINRQQAEVKRLKEEVKAEYGATFLAKSEAIKEYMKILEEKLSQNTDISNVGYQSIIFDMEQGYKEMVGEGK